MRRIITVSVLVAGLVLATGAGAAVAGHRKAHRNSQAASSSERTKVTAGSSKKNRSNVSVGTKGGSQNGGQVGAKAKSRKGGSSASASRSASTGKAPAKAPSSKSKARSNNSTYVNLGTAGTPGISVPGFPRVPTVT